MWKVVGFLGGKAGVCRWGFEFADRTNLSVLFRRHMRVSHLLAIFAM